MPGNEILPIQTHRQYMRIPASNVELYDEMLVVPEGFTQRFTKAYAEWKECQRILDKMVTGQDDNATTGESNS